MTTLRIGKRRQYLRLDSRAVNDERLSYRARGVLAWLLEKPDDWTVRADAIAKNGKEGRDAIRTALNELDACGYLVRRKWRNKDGTWGSEAIVYEHPDLADQCGFPATDDQRRVTGDGELGPLLTNETQNGTQPLPTVAAEPTIVERATTIIKAVWDARKAAGEPVPATYVGARKVVERMLKAGWPDGDVQQACMDAPTISVGWLEGQLRPRNGARQTTGEAKRDKFMQAAASLIEKESTKEVAG